MTTQVTIDGVWITLADDNQYPSRPTILLEIGEPALAVLRMDQQDAARLAAKLAEFAGQAPPEFLTLADIAERAGITRGSAEVYRKRGDLPAPDIMLGRTPGWLTTTIDAWLATRRTWTRKTD